jgi:hypothetical protein
MPSNLLTADARRENAAALAAALGLSLDDAAQALDLEIAIAADSADAVGQQMASQVLALLNRTVRRISPAQTEGGVSVELVIGAAPSRTSGFKLYLDIREDLAIIASGVHAGRTCAVIPPILRVLTACYVAAAVLHYALGSASAFGVPDPLVIRFDELGIDPASFARSIDIEHTYMAGAGAIGNGFLWAARHLDFAGRLEIVDDDHVSSGNLNRQMWFDPDDLEQPKADRLAQKAQPFFPRLKLVPRQCRLQDLPEKSDSPWLRRLIVAVDSRRARRQLQNEFPREVFDASTTDIREVVLHYNLQPTEHACLSCIYEPDAEELSREQHIADHLGISVDEVRTERISASAAQIIVDRFPGLSADVLVGTAYDTLFKKLCAEGRLSTQMGRTIVAPFAFVSVLAGTLLALELVRRLGKRATARDFNYWRVSPWHPLFGRRRIMRTRQPECEFCGKPILRNVNESLWRLPPQAP